MNPAFDTFIKSLRGKEITVIGLGVSNRPLVTLLADAGARVTVRDKNEQIDRAEWEGVDLRLGPDYLDGLSGELIFRTPGLRPDHPALLEAKANGSLVTGEMEVFFSLCPCPVTGVTGSDGKTTTTTLIAEMLRAGGRTVHLGGNIGVPLLALAGDMAPEDRAVVELSSFQLMDMTRGPQTAVITNITPNHLDWHRDMDEYIAAKRRILDWQGEDGLAVLNGDNPVTEKMRGRGRTVFFGGDRIADGVIDGFLPLDGIKLRGYYQVENILAALSAVRELVSEDAIRQVAESFSGVQHRNEFIAAVDGVAYYNNSIGSSPARTAATLRAHGGPVLLIAGGRDKNVPFDELAALFPACIKRLYLIGEAADAIEKAARAVPDAPPIERCAGLEDAVFRARRAAKPGDTVLLSPACTAFDAYKNFEERGRHFVEIVRRLAGENAPAGA
ncbi:MAG: UDP-N-acetylmuramoyl-L-alanine--D-glutamate ligase [Oscillospiraceae bacterium]|jgi:UDP-N-acetylmuramoylalanine--D-glutamate ligase|nr:UDP-N-acetylmuramoyl-L-alanine--D-glutamate ligase [Oscillospiraceae bacterium]